MKTLQSKEEHDEAVKSECVVQYAAENCMPCKALIPHLQEVAKRVDFPVYIIYLDKADGGDDLIQEKEIISVPRVSYYSQDSETEISGRTVLPILQELNGHSA